MMNIIRKIFIRFFTRTAFIFLSMVAVMIMTLLVAATGVEHPAETTAFIAWMHKTRFFWLGWRLVLYAALGWGIWKIHKAPGFRDEYRLPLRRITLASVAFILICEYTRTMS